MFRLTKLQRMSGEPATADARAGFLRFIGASSSWRGMKTMSGAMGGRSAQIGHPSYWYGYKTGQTKSFMSSCGAARPVSNPLNVSRRHAVVVATENKVMYFSILGEVLTLFFTYLVYTRQLPFDIIDLLRKIGIDMTSLGELGIHFGGGWHINVRMVMDYFFVCFLMSIACMFLPIPGPMFIRIRK